MDHEGTREQLELAAVEPGGLERLMAGDTPNAQVVAAHLAGCPSCTDELVRLQRAATLIRASVRELPPADLKERTLATIRAEGVRRPLAVAAPAAVGAGATSATERMSGVPVMASTSTTATDPDRRARRTPPWLGWAGTIAAAVVLSVVTTTAVVNNRVDNQLAAQNAEILALESVTTDTMSVAAEPDAEHVALRSVSGPDVKGELVYSASSTDLVVTAMGLTEPPAGQEYRCWIQAGGKRQPVGKMFFSTHLAYWTGPVAALAGLPDGATFGVSLVSKSGGTVDRDAVLVGEL
jgi:Anti-sigma-K factor rskA